MNSSTLYWTLNALIALLAALNAVFWGLSIKSVGNPSLTLGFLFKLLFDKYFILAIGSAFLAALLKYSIVHLMGVLKGTFFLATSMVAVILATCFVLGERVSPIDWIGIGLIIAGVFILGR